MLYKATESHLEQHSFRLNFEYIIMQVCKKSRPPQLKKNTFLAIFLQNLQDPCKLFQENAIFWQNFARFCKTLAKKCIPGKILLKQWDHRKIFVSIFQGIHCLEVHFCQILYDFCKRCNFSQLRVLANISPSISYQTAFERFTGIEKP